MVLGAAAVAVAAGTAIGLGRPWLAWGLTLVAAAALGATALLRSRPAAAIVSVLLALVSGAGASASWRSVGTSDALLPALAQRRLAVEACGTVRLRRPRSVEMQAEHLTEPRGTWRTREPLRISGPEVRRVRPGERVCARGPLVPPRTGRREAPLLAARQLHIAGQGSVVRLAAAEVRRRFSRAAASVLPRTHAGLLLGMTDGDVELLDERTMENFRTTGMAHLVAVSGSNVAVLLVIVMLACRALIPRGRWLRVAVAAPPLVFFAFLTGLEASVLRAVFTAGVALAVTAGGRTADALRISAFAFIALVLTAPELLVHPGFQLSFAATLGLIVWAAPLTERIERFLPAGRLGRAAAIAAATTVAAQAAVAPLLAWHFGRVPAVGGIANLIVAPLAPVVMIGGALTLGVASMTSGLAWAPATMRLPLDVILGCSRWFAALPAASVGASVLVGAAVTAALAGIVTRARPARTAAGVIVVIAAATAGGQAVAGRSVGCRGPAVHALDVGQGTAVVLHSAGRTVLVDGGPHEGGVVADLQEVGVDRLDAVFVSHGDADHAEGIVDILGRIDVARVIGPEALPNGVGADVVSAARREGVPVENAAAGDSLRFGTDFHIDVLWPEPGEVPLGDEEPLNAFSLVLRARLGRTMVVLPGDIAAEQGSVLADEYIAAPVLIAPHHGSKDLDHDFVDAVAPKVTLVTVGAENTYGHPAPEALRAYARHGSVFRSDQDGRVSICLSDEGAEVWTER